MIPKQTVVDVLADVGAEIKKASASHPPLHSLHEAYAVMDEEIDEVWEIVKQKSSARDLPALRKELIQVAAMAVRTIVDLNLGGANGEFSRPTQGHHSGHRRQLKCGRSIDRA